MKFNELYRHKGSYPERCAVSCHWGQARVFKLGLCPDTFSLRTLGVWVEAVASESLSLPLLRRFESP